MGFEGGSHSGGQKVEWWTNASGLGAGGRQAIRPRAAARPPASLRQAEADQRPWCSTVPESTGVAVVRMAGRVGSASSATAIVGGSGGGGGGGRLSGGGDREGPVGCVSVGEPHGLGTSQLQVKRGVLGCRLLPPLLVVGQAVGKRGQRASQFGQGSLAAAQRLAGEASGA